MKAEILKPEIIIAIEAPELVASLASELTPLGFNCITADNLTDFTSQVTSKKRSPACIILGLTFDNQVDKSLDWLRRYSSVPDAPPVIITCIKDDIEHRLAALRAGAKHYFSIPLDRTYLIGALDHITNRQLTKPYRAILVDDEPIGLEITAKILSAAGIDAHTTTKPAETLSLLDTFDPEVIILDLRMPEISGFELARLIRETNQGRDLPILMLSAERDIEVLVQASQYGVDHFLSKPIEGRVLVDEVKVRAKRYREFRAAQVSLRTELYERQIENETLNNHALVSFSDPSGKLTFVNDYFCTVTGYGKGELIGQPATIVRSNLHPPAFYQQIEDQLGQQQSWCGEVCNKTKSGDLYWVYTTVTPFINDRNELYKIVCIQTDITQSKKDAETLLIAKEEAQNANTAKSQFLANMSHELRTPLNAIVGFSQLLESTSNLDNDARQDLQEIIAASDHLVSLIDEILDLSKIEAGKLVLYPEVFLLDTLIKDCVKLVKPAAEQRAITVIFPPPQTVHCYLDKTRLKQVLLNLLSNAIKYNITGGKIYLSCQQRAKIVRIEVADTGNGITEQEVDSLFKPFSRLESHQKTHQGTGIGLSLCKSLVAQMQGDIFLDRHDTELTRFVVEIPIGETNIQATSTNPLSTTQRDIPETTDASEQLYVVCVDDNEINLKVLSQYLKKRGNIQVTATVDPQEAIDVITSTLPDIAFIDIRMPEIDGFSVLKSVRDIANSHDVMLVAVSADAMPHDIDQAMAAGFDNYITKPVSFSELEAIIQLKET